MMMGISSTSKAFFIKFWDMMLLQSIYHCSTKSKGRIRSPIRGRVNYKISTFFHFFQNIITLLC
jgi:hypothetical protein